MNHNSKQVISGSNVANYINDFFCNIGPSLAMNCKTVWRYYGNRVDDSIHAITDELEIIQLCKNIDIYKASAITNLLSRILKDTFLAIPNKIAVLMTLSLKTQTFPRRRQMLPLCLRVVITLVLKTLGLPRCYHSPVNLWRGLFIQG